jgi:ATP-dependent helicase HepA
MLGALDPNAAGASFKRPLTFAYTARRRTVLSRLGLAAGVRILRYGDVLLEGLQEITSLEDRGRCFALWRCHPDYKPAEIADLFLRFDFIVEADIARAAELFAAGYSGTEKTAARAMRRRGDMLFPPFFHRLWLDEDLRPVEDPKLLRILEARYAPRREAAHQDVNLNPRRIRILASKGLRVVREWPNHVMNARKKAEEDLRSIGEVLERAGGAVDRARIEDAGRFARLRLRIARDDAALAEEDRRRLSIEEPVAEALYEGILKPRVMLDTIGAVFLSNSPFASGASLGTSAEED